MTCTVYFRVDATDIASGQTVCVSGDVMELGGWSASMVIPMQRRDEKVDGLSSWAIETALPTNREVRYRYAVCSFHGDDAIRVHQWESARVPRTVLTQGDKMTVNDGQFGTYNGESKVERGWLTSHSECRLMFHSDPFTPMTGSNVSSYSIRVSMSSLDGLGTSHIKTRESSSTKRMKQCDDVESVYLRLLNSKECKPHQQQPCGRIFNPGDYFVFSAQTTMPDLVMFTIDLYSHHDTDSPVLIGKSWLLGQNIVSDINKYQSLPVISGAQTVGVLSVQCIVIHPLTPPSLCNMKTSYASHWKWNRPTIECSHRGFGMSHHDSPLLQDIPSVLENTIRAMQKGADHGADFVEFDVHVTKDLIPVVYHDFDAKLSVKETSKNGSPTLKWPISELSLDHLRSLRNGHSFVVNESLVYHAKQEDSHILTESDWPAEMRPFPELQEEDNTKEGDFQMLERNVIVDAILNIVLKHAGSRRIIFSAFDADICTMLRLKQNKYPVMYLNYGGNDNDQCYNDPRNSLVDNAMHFALSEEILGMVCHTDDLIKDPPILRAANDRGLVVFLWGEDNNNPEILQRLKAMGVQGIIHDGISSYPENCRNIYLWEKLAAEEKMKK